MLHSPHHPAKGAMLRAHLSRARPRYVARAHVAGSGERFRKSSNGKKISHFLLGHDNDHDNDNDNDTDINDDNDNASVDNTSLAWRHFWFIDHSFSFFPKRSCLWRGDINMAAPAVLHSLPWLQMVAVLHSLPWLQMVAVLHSLLWLQMVLHSSHPFQVVLNSPPSFNCQTTRLS